MTSPHQHTTTGWARAFTASFEAAADQPYILDQGLRLLDSGEPRSLNVNQGFATTKFTLDDGTVLRPRLLIAELSAEEWDRVYEAVAGDPELAQAAGTANLSDLLTEPDRTGGIPLVPAPGDISFVCPCLSDIRVCPHTAAVGHLLAQRLSTAPAALLTLRGRAHQHLKAFLRTTSLPRVPAPAPASAPMPMPIDTQHTSPALPALTDEPPAPAPALATLNLLITDAAHRAAAYLDQGAEPALCADVSTDLARLTATEHGQPCLETAAGHLNLSPFQMRQLTTAFEYGGPAGALCCLQPRPGDMETLAQAEAAIQHLRPAALAPLERQDNRITDTAARIQLRHGPDGRWYPYTDRFGVWRPAPGPDHDPALAYKAARAAQRQR